MSIRANIRILWAFVLFLGLLFSGCSERRTTGFSDLRNWHPMQFDVRFDGDSVEGVQVYRIDVAEKQSFFKGKYFALEGIGFYNDPSSGKKILTELRLFLPEKAYKTGDTLPVTSVKQPPSSKPAVYVKYEEYVVEGKKGLLRFSTQKTTGTPTTSPKTSYGEVTGDIEIGTIVEREDFDGSFHLQLTSGDKKFKREIFNGTFTYKRKTRDQEKGR